jgi:hypothetical protein
VPGNKKATGKGSKKQPKPKKRKQSQKTWLRVAPKPTRPDVEFMDVPSFPKADIAHNARGTLLTDSSLRVLEPVA